MRIYETIYICAPNVSDETLDEIDDLVLESIYDAGGKIIKRERWGKRRLAFEIKRFRDGIFNYVLYGGDGRVKEELERRLRFSEDCLRYLTVRLDLELRGKKHKIFTKEELRLALQMETPRATRAKEEKPAGEESRPESRGKAPAEAVSETVEAQESTTAEPAPAVSEAAETGEAAEAIVEPGGRAEDGQGVESAAEKEEV